MGEKHYRRPPMKFLNIIVEGSSEEAFVNDVLVAHFAKLNIFVSTRKITTGWDRLKDKPSKGGLLKYVKFRNDVLRWIESDGGRNNTWYSSMLDLYAFPKDVQSPYSLAIQQLTDPFAKVKALEIAIATDIKHSRFIPYVQLHEFEAFIMVDPERLLLLYPDKKNGIEKLKKDIGSINPEEINESPQSAPSKRIIKFIPSYAGQKAQVGPLVAGDIGLTKLRANCKHFNEWITNLETIP
jgi:Domain of unknown function (DUF4276)